MEQGYSNAQGYGIFLWKKGVLKKRNLKEYHLSVEEKNIAAWTEEQAALARAQGQQEGASSSDSGGSSNAPLIIGGVFSFRNCSYNFLIVKMRK